jgi:lipopolysaccharide biosynthesis protein
LENEKSEETEAKDSLRRELETSKQRILDLEKEVSDSLMLKQKAVEKSKKFKKLHHDSKALASALHVSFTNQVHEINNLKTKLGKKVENGSIPPPNIDEDSEDSE